jgi:hypothetical protein
MYIMEEQGPHLARSYRYSLAVPLYFDMPSSYGIRAIGAESHVMKTSDCEKMQVTC